MNIPYLAINHWDIRYIDTMLIEPKLLNDCIVFLDERQPIRRLGAALIGRLIIH